jgi:RNA polymerase sigma-70 factor (ECF subfamily)
MMTFEQLYATHYPDVFRFAMWLTRDRTEAEDVTSETFVRAWTRRERIRTDTLKGYLFTIARNIFLKHRNQSTKHEQLPEGLADGAPDPQRTAAARSDFDRVTSALYRMPTVDRLALVLRTEQSLPYDEIARILVISAAAARVKVHRARRRLLAETMMNNGGEKCP